MPQHGPGDQVKHDVGGHHVAGQAEQNQAPVGAVQHRICETPARADVERQEADAACLAHDIGIALRGTAAGQEHVQFKIEGALQQGGKGRAFIGTDAKVSRIETELPQAHQQQRPIGVVGAGGRQRCRRIGQFVAGGGQAHTQAAPDLDLRHPCAGR